MTRLIIHSTLIKIQWILIKIKWTILNAQNKINLSLIMRKIICNLTFSFILLLNHLLHKFSQRSYIVESHQMTFILNATWKYVDLYDNEFIKILSNITEKMSSYEQLQNIIIIKAQRNWTHRDLQWQQDCNRLK